jgi:DNA-directed RNA polymerase subunit E'/Rpb7
MSSIIISKRITIEPKYLTKNIITYMKTKLEDIMIGDCSLDFGYVTQVNKILKIEDNYISPATGNAIFIIKFEAITLKPVENDIMKGDICMVFQHGIFVEIDQKMKILIPVDNMKDFEYDNLTASFVKGKKTLKVGNNISVRILKIKYEQKEFSCIGELV